MGQFEIKSIKQKELVPDVITLKVYARVENNNVLDNYKSILEAQDNLKEVVAKLACDLESITNDLPQYAEAQRLLEILRYFEPISKDIVPSHSLVKEFLGGGDFKG